MSKDAAASAAGQRTRKVFVGGLPPSVDEGSLRAYFGEWGCVEDAVVMYDHENRRPRGFGFITYTGACGGLFPAAGLSAGQLGLEAGAGSWGGRQPTASCHTTRTRCRTLALTPRFPCVFPAPCASRGGLCGARVCPRSHPHPARQTLRGEARGATRLDARVAARRRRRERSCRPGARAQQATMKKTCPHDRRGK